MTNKRWSAAELEFDAKLREVIDTQFAKWEAEDARRGKPPNVHQVNDRLLWESMIEDTEWDRFYGVLEDKDVPTWLWKDDGHVDKA
jgi:hypothetical protein